MENTSAGLIHQEKIRLLGFFIIMSVITLIVVGTIASRTSIDYSEGALQDDYGWDDEESGDYGDLEESDYYED